MAIPKKLLKFLDDNKVKYEILEHRKVYTAFDRTETQKQDPKIVVKTLVMKLDNNYGLALIPSNKNLDKAKLKKAAKPAFKKVDFAKEPWMKKNVLGKVGATPPFGSLMKMPVYIDASLLKNKDLIVNSGEYTESIKLKTKAFEKLEPEFIKGSFSQKK
ncbi:MAG: YbaK/EbsC family protein [Patescibacteria group bacterium]|nr:YbaK/EbsC family protein [Patescibacteria group bacterium]